MITLMNCAVCRYCDKYTMIGKPFWYCCYDETNPDEIGLPRYALDGRIPSWCPYKNEEKREEDKNAL